jgi:coenzyme Q-binding protein COQ10
VRGAAMAAWPALSDRQIWNLVAFIISLKHEWSWLGRARSCNPGGTNTGVVETMTSYTQKRRLQYQPPQLFDLVADVESYPQFIPRVVESHIRQRHDHTMVVDMTIAAGPIRKRFSTTAVLNRPRRIDIGSRDSLFDRFEQRWTFTPAAGGGTEVEYHVDFAFRSRILQMASSALFGDVAASTMAGFMRHAHRMYGAGTGVGR